MAEYIWIDGTNGVRSKTKVRIFHFPHYNPPLPPNAQPQCTRLAPFFNPLPWAKPVSLSQKRSYRTSGQQDKPWRKSSTLRGSGEERYKRDLHLC